LNGKVGETTSHRKKGNVEVRGQNPSAPGHMPRKERIGVRKER